GTLADVRHLAVSGVAGLLLVGSLGAFTLEAGKLVLEGAGDRSDVAVAVVLQLLLLEVVLDLEVGQFGVTVLGVDAGDHVGGEVDDLLKVLRCQVKEVAQAGGNALEVPDVRYGSSQLDVAHALATDLGAGDLDATALTDDALEAHALVLAAVAFPVTGRTEDLLAEEAVLLGLERAVVDGFRLLNLAVRPATDVFRGGEADLHEAEGGFAGHMVPVLSCSLNSEVLGYGKREGSST